MGKSGRVGGDAQKGGFVVGLRCGESVNLFSDFNIIWTRNSCHGSLRGEQRRHLVPRVAKRSHEITEQRGVIPGIKACAPNDHDQ